MCNIWDQVYLMISDAPEAIFNKLTADAVHFSCAICSEMAM